MCVLNYVVKTPEDLENDISKVFPDIPSCGNISRFTLLFVFSKVLMAVPNRLLRFDV